MLAGQELHSVYKFVQFMTECGSVPDNTFSLGVLDRLCSEFSWEEREYAFALRLIDLGGPITFPPQTRLGKQNTLGLLLKSEDREYFDLIFVMTLHSNFVLSDRFSRDWKDHSPGI